MWKNFNQIQLELMQKVFLIFNVKVKSILFRILFYKMCVTNFLNKLEYIEFLILFSVKS